MSIVLYLGRNVNEYEKIHKERIRGLVGEGAITCGLCLLPMRLHSNYVRTIRETGQKLTIAVAWCRPCKNWDALLPDFLLKGKHYSGNEIESVIIDSATVAPVNQIEREASESTVRRWIRNVGERIKAAVGTLKGLFGCACHSASETAAGALSVYGTLEQALERAPSAKMYSGNKLGLANIWLCSGRIKSSSCHLIK